MRSTTPPIISKQIATLVPYLRFGTEYLEHIAIYGQTALKRCSLVLRSCKIKEPLISGGN